MHFNSKYGSLKHKNEIDLSHGCILYVEGVTASFDGFKALDDLNLYIDSGMLHCIIGPNGAGKTTLLDVVTGKTKPDSGKVFFGQSIDLGELSEPEIAHLGIGRKFQKPTVYENHTLFENLELAQRDDRGIWHSLFARLTPEQKDRIEEVLETIGLTDHIHDQAGLLSHGQKQWLEIGMLLMQEPQLLLLDEPVAGMTPQEVEHTASLFKSLAGEHTVVVVEHDMEFVRSIAERVTVLHEGRVLADGNMDAVQSNEKVVEVYLGGFRN